MIFFFHSSMASVKDRMDSFIKDFPVFIVSKSYCPFCNTAKEVFNRYDIPPDKVKIIEIEGYPDCNEIQDYMSQVTGARTVSTLVISRKNTHWLYTVWTFHDFSTQIYVKSFLEVLEVRNLPF